MESTAIVGSLATENLGIERVIRNINANPNIRFLILCGRDSRGHKAGQALIFLKNNGIDQNKRIVGAQSPRPVLKNVTVEEIEAFRKNITIIDEINTRDVTRLKEVIKVYLETLTEGVTSVLPPKVSVPKEIVAERPAKREWVNDPEGFFLVLVNRDTKTIVCEHYTLEGSLNEVIRGTTAEDVAYTAIKRGLLSRLDHAAYLGRELAKAETTIQCGMEYIQDKPLIFNQ